MKTFALAAVAVAGLLCTTASADAQYRYRSGGYVVPNYGYNNYSTPYTVPAYNGVNGVGSFTPLGGTPIIVQSGYTAPVYNTPVYHSSYYPSFNTYGGTYVAPYSGYRGRRW